MKCHHLLIILKILRPELVRDEVNTVDTDVLSCLKLLSDGDQIAFKFEQMDESTSLQIFIYMLPLKEISNLMDFDGESPENFSVCANP